MNPETKTCQNCKNSFAIEPEDFKFYDKIKVPPPTWCPECRMMRRFSWRNERSLYRSKCAFSGKDIITGFAPDSGLVVYDRDTWWSDKWDPFASGKEYDFSKPFFAQFYELMHKMPLPAVFNARTINSDYAQHTGDFKNGYLVSASWSGENVSYASRVHDSKDSLDVFFIVKSELCYETIDANKSYQTFFSQNIDNCVDSVFLFECRGCSHCFGSTNLRNKNYYIFNEPYSKEEYFKKLTEFDIGSYNKLTALKQKFSKFKLNALRRYANIINSQKVSGDNITNTSNCRECFDTSNDIRDSAFVQNAIGQMRDSYDGYGVGAGAELLYEVFDTGVSGSKLCFGGIIYGGFDVFYSYMCHGCNNLFACIGLRNKSYCILNKQYTKEEYEKLVPKIIAHMSEMPYIDKKGRVYKYGEFFPPELSPFSYNETIAQEYFPLTKEEAIERGYWWKDPEPRNYQITLKTEDLPDHIKDVKDSILNEIIQCAHWELGNSVSKCNEQCTQAFRIIPQELQFLRKMNLPLPRLCPNCRHYQRIRQRNPLKLWHRRCECGGQMSKLKGQNQYKNTADHIHHKKDEACPNEFETTYAPERPEIVYCEACYLREVV